MKMEKKTKNGVPTTFRIPAELKEKLTKQAERADRNLSQHLEFLLLTSLEDTAKLQEDLNQAQKENLQLKANIKKLKQEVSFLTEERKKTIEILIQNETILKEAFVEFKSHKFDKEVLVNKGFNFYYATHKAVEMDYIYTGVFSYSYTSFKNNKVKVVKSSSNGTY